jgi:hypothetical protein
VLREYRFQMPELNAAFLAGGMRAWMLLLIVGGAAWGLFEVFGRFGRKSVSS